MVVKVIIIIFWLHFQDLESKSKKRIYMIESQKLKESKNPKSYKQTN